MVAIHKDVLFFFFFSPEDMVRLTFPKSWTQLKVDAMLFLSLETTC